MLRYVFACPAAPVLCVVEALAGPDVAAAVGVGVAVVDGAAVRAAEEVDVVSEGVAVSGAGAGGGGAGEPGSGEVASGGDGEVAVGVLGRL